MQVRISKKLKDLYQKAKKSPGYSLQFVADSIDPDCCASAAALVQQFMIDEELCEVTISDDLIAVLKKELDLTEISDMLLEALLWVAILFPEV